MVAIDDAAGGPAIKETTLAYDPSLGQEQVDTLTLAVGPAAATPAAERVDGIDVTIDLGQDFMAFLSGSPAAVAVTWHRPLSARVER